MGADSNRVAKGKNYIGAGVAAPRDCELWLWCLGKNISWYAVRPLLFSLTVGVDCSSLDYSVLAVASICIFPTSG